MKISAKRLAKTLKRLGLLKYVNYSKISQFVNRRMLMNIRTPQNLYIIGNGFDLHHRIPSRYSQFGEWLQENHHGIYTSPSPNICTSKTTRLGIGLRSI